MRNSRSHLLEAVVRSLLTFIVLCFSGGIVNAFQDNITTSSGSYTIKSLEKVGDHTIGVVFDIEQDTTGYLWLGTNRGLVRYNGSSLKVYNLKSNPELQTESIRFVEISSSNEIWFATLRGLFYIENDSIHEFLDNEEKHIRRIYNMAMDGSGNIWYATKDELYQIRDKKLSQKEPIGRDIFMIFPGKEGKIWIPERTPDNIRLLYYQNGKLNQYVFQGTIDANIQSLAESRSGEIILGTALGDLYQIKDGKLTLLDKAPFKHDRLRDIHIDDDGDIWFFRKELYRLSEGVRYTVIPAAPGLRNEIRKLFRDRDGTLWWASMFGASYLVDDPFTQFKFDHDKEESRPLSVDIDKQGNMWVGTGTRGLYHLDGKTLVGAKDNNLLPRKINELESSLREGVFVSTDIGIFHLKMDGESYRLINKITDLPGNLIDNPREGELWVNVEDPVAGWTVKLLTEEGALVREIEEVRGRLIQFMHLGPDGRYWIGTELGLYCYNYDDDQTFLFDLGSDLTKKYMRAICNGPDSSVWVGTYGSGMVNIKGEEFFHYNTVNGLPANQVWMICPTTDGGLWFHTSFSEYGTIHKVNPIVNSGRREIAMGESFPNSKKVSLFLDSGYVHQNDDELLFMNKRGLIKFSQPPAKGTVSNPRIEYVYIDSKPVTSDSSIVLNPSARNLEIHYSVIDFLKGDNQKFEYFLEGYDEGWKEVGNRTTAYYSSLPPGTYQFRLRINSTNNYVDLASPLIITQEEYWWKTSFATASGVLVLLLLVGGAFRIRINTIKRQREVLQEKVNERTAEIQELNENLELKIQERTREIVEINEILKESEERYSYAIDASSDGIFDYDVPSGKVKYSPSIYTMIGFEPYEFEESVDAFVDHMHKDDKVSHGEVLESSLKTAGPEGHFQHEFRVISKSGEIVWMRIKGKVVGYSDNGEPVRIVGTHIDITSEKRKNQEMLEAVLKTEDTERNRISKEIHDSLQQKLIVASLNFNSVKKLMDSSDERVEEKFGTGWQYLQDAIGESRAVAHSLMPKAIHDFGIISAFESLIDDLNKSHEDTEFSFFHNFKEKRIDNQQIEVTLYRILQESTNNIIKYAEATHVDIQLKDYQDIYLLTVEDDGNGFKKSEDLDKKGGFGINGMRNRIAAIGGFFEIDSSIGRGTTIIVEINKKDLK